MARDWKYGPRTTFAPGGSADDVIGNALQARSLDASGSDSGTTTAFTLGTESTVTVANNASGLTADMSVGTVAQSMAGVLEGDALLELTTLATSKPVNNAARSEMLTDAFNHQNAMDAVPAAQATSASGNAGSSASDSEPCPTLTLNATDPAHATFTVSGLASDVHGTVTFADVNGVQDVVNIGSNGTYSADLSNLANGTIDYTLAVTDPMGHTTIVDPPVQLGTVAGFTLDANGWPIITPPASAHIIYVSSSTGNDNNDGLTPATAKATIAGGEALLRNGQPDELLLKAGDTFVNQSFGYLHVSGQSMTAPMVFGTYGSGPAPIVETPANEGIGIGNSGGGGGNFIVVEGINFYAYTRDPSNPAYAGPNTTESGAAFFGTANVLLVGNKFSFFTDDIVFTPNGSVIDPSSSLTLYRNVITNSWSTTEHSQGLYAAGAGALDIEQNIFDHNGWNASIPGAEANIFNRNVYFSALDAPVTFIGNISANSSSEGAQFRSGGTITNNLFVADSLGFSIGSNPAGSGEASPTITSSVATGNVILNSNDIQSAQGSLLRSSGIGVTNASGAGVQVTNNIIADPVNSQGTGISIDSNVSGVNTSNNIIYNYFAYPIDDGGTNDKTSNAINLTGYANPNVSVGSYNASLGGSATLAAFMAAADNQNMSNWNPAYTATAVNSYIQAGFSTGSGAPGVPTIVSFSTDSGVAGDRITNDATLTLTGTAPANSAVTVFDGSTQIGTTTANASGAWSYTTAALTNGAHSLTATDTVSGTTSAASAAFAVTVDTVAPNAPVISSNSASPSNVVTLNGTAEANSTVAVLDGTTQLGTATANSSGAWTYTTAALAAGAHSLTATATDAAGNTGTASSTLNLTLTPSAVNLVAQTTSWSNFSFPTQATNFTASFDVAPSQPGEDAVIGLAATNAADYTDLAAIVRFNNTNTIDVRNGSAYSADASVPYSAGTTYHVRMVVNLSAHTYSVYVTPQGGSEIALATNYAFRTEQATDASLSDIGGFSTSGSATVLNFSIGGASPAAPTITSFSPDTGVVGDGITDPAILTLTGTAVANSTVKIYDGSTLLGTATASGTGAWNFTTVPLPDGLHKFTATDTVNGTTGAPSAVMNVTVDTVAPAAPTIASFSTDSGTVGDHITNDATLALTGTAEANSTVKVFDGTTLLGSVVANGSGAWTYTTAALANGAHSLTATASDAAANTSAASAALTVTIDTVAPAAPVITLFTPDTGTVGDGITNANTLALTGTAEANSTVKVFDGTTLLGSVVANSSGAWTYTTAALANGAHSLTATASDAAANTSAASAALTVTIDTVPPAAPVITLFTPDTGTVGDGITNANTLALTGTAEANSTVKVFDGTTLLGSVVANGSGAWTYTTAALANGAHSLTATASDAAGNTGVASAALAITVTTPPGAPTITSFSPDTGAVGDGITDPAILTLTGTAVTNSTVNVYDGTTLLGSATASGTGAWNFTTVPLPDGLHSFTATDTMSGVTSAASAVMNVTIDTVAPAAPTIASFSTDSGAVGDHITNDTTLTLTGAAEANSTVKIFDGATPLGNALANSSGAWTYTTAALANGAHTLTATASDAAANTSAASVALT